jgi:hypothetical protein
MPENGNGNDGHANVALSKPQSLQDLLERRVKPQRPSLPHEVEELTKMQFGSDAEFVKRANGLDPDECPDGSYNACRWAMAMTTQAIARADEEAWPQAAKASLQRIKEAQAEILRLYQLGRKHLQAIKQAKTADAYAGAE